MNDWSTKTIKDLGRVVTGKTPPKVNTEYFDGDELFISPKDLDWDQLYVRETETTITTKALEKFRNQVIPRDTVMFTSLSFAFGKMGIASKPSLTNQQINSIIVSDKNNFRFVYYLLRLYKPIIFSYNSGIDTPIVPKSVFESIEVKCPDLRVQKKIAAVLSAYDDLIENNKRRIAVLEKMAEEIYREWFVRMRFPGHEKVKFVKGLPEGWRIESIGKLCARVTDGSHFSPESQADGKPMASVKDMRSNGFFLKTMRTISDQDFESLRKGDCQPQKNDILIAKDGSYLKHVFVWDRDYEVVILSSIAILRPNLNEVLPHFLSSVLRQDSTKSMMSGYVSGSALPRIILKDFKKMKLLIPDFGLMSEFETHIAPFYQSINMANRKIERLEEARDKLLPRLISGKLSVEDLDIRFPPSMQQDMTAD